MGGNEKTMKLRQNDLNVVLIANLPAKFMMVATTLAWCIIIMLLVGTMINSSNASAAEGKVRVAVVPAPGFDKSKYQDALCRNLKLLLSSSLSKKFAAQANWVIVPPPEISRERTLGGNENDLAFNLIKNGVADVCISVDINSLANHAETLDSNTVWKLRPSLTTSCELVYWSTSTGGPKYKTMSYTNAYAKKTYEIPLAQSFTVWNSDADQILEDELSYFVGQIVDKSAGLLEAEICSLPVRRGSSTIANENEKDPTVSAESIAARRSDINATEATPSTKTIRDKWALVVGVSKFQDKRIPQLRYSAKDARDFRDFLVKEANFAPDHVRLLLDEKATERRVMSELGNKFLARVAKPDDLIVLFFSTHGSSAKADVRGKNYIVAYDSDRDDLYTTGIEMQKIVESINDRVISGRTLLVLDACHSGATTNGAKAMGDGGNFDAQELAQGSGKLVICSSQPDQISWESTRYQNGIFTRKLLEGFRSQGKNTKLGDAFNVLRSAVRSEAQEDHAAKQEPVLKSKWDGNDLLLCAPPSAPQALPAAVKQILEPDSSSVLAPPRPPTTTQKRPTRTPLRK